MPEGQRDWFKALLSSAQRAGSWSEEHAFWLENHNQALIRRAVLEWGKRFREAGAIEDRDDIFFLTTEEIERTTTGLERYNLRPLIDGRKRKWEEDCKREYPLFITKLSPPEVIQWLAKSRDPIAIKVVVGRFPAPKPELKADLLGICGSPGSVEGIARVILTPDRMGELQKGDILVCPGTTVAWTPVFAIISGVVTDAGGSLSHAAIVSREHGIPCVLNTFEATRKIKTGNRIRVDADVGAVYILGE